VSERQNSSIDNFLYKFVFNASQVILLSSFLYRDVQKYVPESRIYYCPNGIPDIGIEFMVHSFNRCEIPEIFFLSNMMIEKGVFVLLESAKILTEQNIRFHITLAGAEADITSSQLENRINNLGLQKVVTYVAKKYGNEKESYFNKAQIFVFPTFYKYETFGLVLLEAMQHKLPVVSTFEGGIPSVVSDGETGFLVPQKDAGVLAEKMKLLINDKELCLGMGIAGRKRYEQYFRLDIFENRLKEIFGEVIAKEK
jgi:glycosyltransferase involved in cell wall biosynthesis